jgi:hypothetical protein
MRGLVAASGKRGSADKKDRNRNCPGGYAERLANRVQKGTKRGRERADSRFFKGQDGHVTPKKMSALDLILQYVQVNPNVREGR